MDDFPESLTMRQNARDTRLIKRAIKNRWPIAEHYREALIARQVLIAAGSIPEASIREQTDAFKAILAAESQNQIDDARTAPQQIEHEHHHTHDIGQVTKENIEAQRAKRFADLAGIV